MWGCQKECVIHNRYTLDRYGKMIIYDYIICTVQNTYAPMQFLWSSDNVILPAGQVHWKLPLVLVQPWLQPAVP